jgi:hypothetical protein
VIIGSLSAIDRNHCPPSIGTSGRNRRNPHARRYVPALGKTLRLRDKDHRKFVLRQPCLVCGRVPSDPHHLSFTQPRALGRRVSDEFIVPVCRVHHRELHRSGVRRADFRDQSIIHHGTRRGRPLNPRVIAAGGDAQDAAYHGDGVTGPVLAHELEPVGGITSVSRANQAAAFERISRSNLSWRFSRRRRLSSSRSAVVRPSSRRPASLWGAYEASRLWGLRSPSRLRD